jgi:hypothetical protein
MTALRSAIVVVAVCTLLLAQNKPKSIARSKPGSPASPEVTMKPEPAPEMMQVLKSVGTWSIVVKNEPSEWNPKGSTDKGTMVMSKGPGGLSVIQDIRTNGPMGPYQGHAIIYWDTIAKRQSSVYCDNISGCSFGVAKPAGANQWSTEVEQEFQGKRMKLVSHGTIVDEKTTHEEFTQSIDGGPMVKLMTIDSKRVGQSGSASRKLK